METYKEITTEISKDISKIRKLIPETLSGFSTLASEATKDGALSKKTKEFIALAIGIANHCDGCIGFHIKALVQLGTTEEELAEVLGMTIYMGGGPSLMYAASAMRAFHEFKKAA